MKMFHDESISRMTPKLTDITFTKDIVESTIKSLKTNSAPGPDGMTCEILAKCAPVISEPLDWLALHLNFGSVYI